jgi:lysozyme
MSPVAVPISKPNLHPAELEAHLADLLTQENRFKYPIVVLGIRGYYKRTMGNAEKNDINMYDDALFVKTPDGIFAFNGNTDPSTMRKGSGTGANKGMATLKPGTYYAHRIGLHNGKYIALVQRAANVTVIRDGEPPYEVTGMFGINIHMGYFDSTGSEGCQTVYKTQWPEFITLVTKYCSQRWPAEWAKFTGNIKAGKNPVFDKLIIPYKLVENA